MKVVKISHIPVGKGHPVVLIAGPCVIESTDLLITTGSRIKELADQYGFPYILKSSFEKANRTAVDSYRGPGLEKGLEALGEARKALEVPILTDIHLPDQAKSVSEVVDCLQIPAFLCRQTELIEAAARTDLPVNIKKGQFLAAESMQSATKKALGSGNGGVLLTERGSTFGYHDLVVDMRSLAVMADMGVPVIFDATHSVQKPGGLKTGGERRFVSTLASAAAATGAIDGIFLEVHPQPEKALSDAESQLSLDQLEPLLETLRAIFNAVEHLKPTGSESSE